ncbi:UNVERIFIED_CONTAM: hypothetical protein GTU68_062524 [Idotea baltica]|nr:hypothetical protein [Idotea baltica]
MQKKNRKKELLLQLATEKKMNL